MATKNRTAFQSQNLRGTVQINPPTVIGSAFFVDSVNGSANNSGSSWDNAFATVDQAIAECTAIKGDHIYAAPWHVESESVSSASIFTMSKAGVSLIGITQGRQRPTFTISIADATATVSAANCLIKNIKIVSAIEDLAVGLTLSAAADGTTVDGCILADGGTAILEMVLGISIAAAAADITINDNFFNTFAAGSGTLSAIKAVGAADRLWITNNVFSGDWNTSACDLSTAASLDIFVADNTIYNLDAAAGLAIDCNASTTGSIVRNLIFAGLNASAALVAAGCHACENYQTTVEAESGNIVPVVGNWAA